MDLLIFILTLGATYFIGTAIIEKKHYRSIKKRERKFLLLPAVTAKNIIDKGQVIKKSKLVYGNAVISIDHFKKFLAGLKNIFGGEVSAYETILDRARREAILRMKESTPEADIIINTRIETSTIGKSRKGDTGCSEALAYGTAITFEETELKKLKEQAAVVRLNGVSGSFKNPKKTMGLFELGILVAGIIILVYFFFLLNK